MAKRRYRWGRIAAAVVGLGFAVTMLTGWYDGDQVLVEDEYTVKAGDTLRSISEEYLQKNTGGRRYILEFESGIREINPELYHTVDIYPGQVIKINYWIKK